MELGEKVRQARMSHKLTVDALGKASGLSKGFISQVESGRSNPSLSSLDRIAAALNISVPNLLEDTERPLHANSENTVSPRFYCSDDPTVASEQFIILDGPAGTRHALAKLPPGAALRGSLRTGPATGTVLLVVISGEATLCGVGPDRKLRAGDAVTLRSGSRYMLENGGSSTVSVLLSMENSAELPEIILSEAIAGAALHSAPRQTYSTEGPLRLAALRASGRNRRAR